MFLLGQLSQQLAGFANGTDILPQAYSPPPPTTSIIWVTAIWLLSLVLGIMSALSATLTLQGASRYLELPRTTSSPSQQARVRSFLFFGAQKYGMINAVEMTSTLLHLSMLLFFVGLDIFFFTAHTTIGVVVSISVGLIGVAYLTISILPCMDYHCPYYTPMSTVWWYFWHTSLFALAFCLRWSLRQLHNCLVPYNLGEITSRRQYILIKWLQTIEDSAKRHGRHLKDGFRRSIVRGALEAPAIVDLQALTWLLKVRSSKVQEFVANIPGGTLVQLMGAPVEAGNVIFREHLLALLRSCAPGTVGLDEDMRRRRLLVCLDAVHHIVKASCVPYGVSPSESVLHYVRTNFANIALMRALWADSDPSIRITAHSICALLARHLLRKYPLEESELAWLQDVMGMPSNAIYNSLDNLSTVDSVNVDAYVYGVFSRRTDNLSIKEATSFLENLTILTSAGSGIVFRRDAIEGTISALIQRADEEDSRLHEIVGNLRETYEKVFPDPPPEPQISNIVNQQDDEHEKLQ